MNTIAGAGTNSDVREATMIALESVMTGAEMTGVTGTGTEAENAGAEVNTVIMTGAGGSGSPPLVTS